MVVSVVSLIAPALAIGCRAESPDAQGGLRNGAAVSFETVFQDQRETALQVDVTDPIANAVAIAVTDDAFFIADIRGPNVKVFGRSGHRISTLGRAGDGPGEFRAPAELALSGSGDTLLVLDRRRQILSTWSRSGEFLGERLIPGLWVDMERFASGDRILLAGRRRAPDGELPTTYYALHEYDFAGDYLGSYIEDARPDHPLQQTFHNPFVAVSGGVIAMGWFDSATLRFAEGSGRSEREIGIDAPWYRPPHWPTGGRGARGQLTMEEINAWVKRQMLITDLEGISGSRFLMRIQQYDSLDIAYRYIVLDSAGRPLVSTHPSPLDIIATRADTAFTVVQSINGTSIRAFTLQIGSR